MSILGFISMIGLMGVSGVVCYKLPYTGIFTAITMTIAGMFALQAIGINTGCWLMYQGVYLIAPGGI